MKFGRDTVQHISGGTENGNNQRGFLDLSRPGQDLQGEKEGAWSRTEDAKFSQVKHSPCEGGGLVEGTDIPLTMEPGVTSVSLLGLMLDGWCWGHLMASRCPGPRLEREERKHLEVESRLAGQERQWESRPTRAVKQEQGC